MIMKRKTTLGRQETYNLATTKASETQIVKLIKRLDSIVLSSEASTNGCGYQYRSREC